MNELDNRASNFYVCLYWAELMAEKVRVGVGGGRWIEGECERNEKGTPDSDLIPFLLYFISNPKILILRALRPLRVILSSGSIPLFFCGSTLQ